MSLTPPNGNKLVTSCIKKVSGQDIIGPILCKYSLYTSLLCDKSHINSLILLEWLENAGLIYRARATGSAKSPLSHYADKACFKIYALDVGLLGAMSRSPVELLSLGDRIFNEYDGAFVENFAAQQLIAHFGQPVLYWRSKGGKAELDFLCDFSGRMYPLEVKAGINPRSKSLRSYNMQFSPSVLARATLLNLKKDGKILNLPLYALSLLPDMVSLHSTNL